MEEKTRVVHGYKINNDGLNVWVSEYGLNSKGNPYEDVASGYHQTFKKALESFARWQLIGSGVKECEELLKKGAEIEEKLLKIINENVKEV